MEATQSINYLLGIETSKALNLDTGKTVYNTQMVVNQSVYNWLMMHDVELQATGVRVFICNKVRYVDLGPQLYKYVD